jgi:hypothetical protein
MTVGLDESLLNDDGADVDAQTIPGEEILALT